MEQTKRPLLNDIDNNNKRTKMQISITKFEDLSNELFYEIFEHLDVYHVYEAFFNLNYRFDDLLIDSTLPMNINISLMSKSTYEHYNINMILPNIDRIRSFHISNRFIYDYLLSPIFILTKCRRLERLRLDNINIEYLEKMLRQLTSLTFLSSLIIIGVDCRESDVFSYSVNIRNVICDQIFRLRTLKYCNLSLKTSFNGNSLPVATNEYSSIEHLVIDNIIYRNELHSLLSHVPQLRRLDIHSFQNNMQKRRVVISVPELKYITHVSLKFIHERFNEVEQLIINLFSRIEILRISIERSDDVTYADNDRWQRLILSHMTNLRIFDIQHHNWPITNTSNNINPFTSSFWIERQWFFDYQICQLKDKDQTFFYSTNPYRRISYTSYEPSNGQTCLNSRKTNLQSVHHLTIQNEKGLINCINYFPNSTALTLGTNFTKHRHSIFTILNNIIPLKQLTQLDIKFQQFSLIKIIELLCFMPNIHRLVLHSMSLYGNTIEIIKQNESFQLLSHLNVITSVTIRDICTLDKIQLLIDLCPRVQHLAFHTLTKDCQPITRFLLDKTKRNGHHLNSLCFLRAGRYWHRKLNTLIQSETLLNDYMLKQFCQSLHLWW